MVIDNKGTQQIETERLILRRFKRTDTTDMLKYWISFTEVQKNYGEAVYKTKVEVDEVLDKWGSSYDNSNFYKWAIILKNS